MIDSLNIAATGMNAQQRSIDVIANNLANLNTPGFKKSRVDFEDLMYGQLLRTTGLVGDPARGVPLGMGTAIAGSMKDFSLGDIKTSESRLDFAIRGDGFFEVVLPDGSFGYTRTGSFHVDEDRTLVTSDGHALSAQIQVPIDAEELIVEPDGVVRARISGERDPQEIGRLELARFVNPGGLDPIGDNLYRPTQVSGDALYANPGEEGVGLVAQGFLEASNVNLVEELTQLLLAQRAYEVNSRVIQAADELLSIANNLRR